MTLPLTQKEFVIAGLLSEGPCYGYEIEQKIENRGMREWTKIGFSSIYHILNKLTKAGYATKTPKIVGGKIQQIYQLTPRGKEVLNRQIRKSITTVQKSYSDFDVAIANTMGIPSEEVRALLGQRIEELDKKITELENLKQKKLENGTPDIPAVTILFDRPLALLRAEKTFLQSYIEKF